MNSQAEISFRKKCQFEVSFRYELFYSLNALLDPDSRIHPGWRSSALSAVGKDFERFAGELGRSWEIWPVMAALLPGAVPRPSFDSILETLEDLPIERFQEKMLRGLIHSESALGPLLKGKISLKSSLARLPKEKREWVHHIGLFPYDPDSPQVMALERLLSDGENFRKIALQIVKIYWERSFRFTWERLQPQIRRSAETRARLFHSCTFAEFAKQTLLRIDFNENKGEIRALRGGYRLRLGDVEACYFLPSAFNDRRFWSAFNDSGGGTTVYFPYFDPAITLDLQIAGELADVVEPPLDPALIFKALGDSTRFAVASLLARSPKSSVELAKILSVSKPTISHHVHLLREAGLLQETYVNGAVELQLRRRVLEQLSDLVIAKLFDNDEPLQLKRTRL